MIYDLYTFRQFVETNFSTYITGQVFNTSIRSQKVYFTLEACPGGYNLLMADSGNEKNLPLDLQLKQTLLPGRNDRHRNPSTSRTPEPTPTSHSSPKTANTANTTKTWANSQNSDQNGESATADSPFFHPSSALLTAHPTPRHTTPLATLPTRFNTSHGQCTPVRGFFPG